MRNKTRLTSLRIILISVLFFSGCTNKVAEQKLASGKALTIIEVTDLHFLDHSLYDDGIAYQKYTANGDGRMWPYNNELIDAFVDKMIQIKPDILIISGDLTNNGEKVSHEKLAEKLKKIETEAGTRILIVPGNHDLLNAWARSFVGDKQNKISSVTPVQFKKIYDDFGYGEAILKDSASLSYLAAPTEDIWFLMLDTNKYSSENTLWPPYSNGAIRPETLEWIKVCVKLAHDHGARIVTVMHHNLLSHNELFTGYVIDNQPDVVPLFETLGLDLVLSGHIHIQDIRSHTDGTQSVVDIATSSLLMYPYQYGVLTYHHESGFDYQTDRLDMAAWAKQNQSTDPKLLDFDDFASTYFKQASYRKAYTRLFDSKLYSDQELDEMAQTMSELNLYYFGGHADVISDQIRTTLGYRLWRNAAEPEFMVNYVYLMANPSLVDRNKIHIN